MNRWLDQPAPDDTSWWKWLATDEARFTLDPEPGPTERECTADRLYHEAIQWAAANEPDPSQRRLLIREAYTSPEMAAWHARAHGYAQAVDAHRAELQAVIDQRDAMGAHVAAISRASRHHRIEAQAARERLLAALYRVGLVAIIAVGLLVLRVAQNWIRGW